MPYIHAFPLVYRSTDIFFCLADCFIKPATPGKKRGDGGREGASRAVQVTALYFGVGIEDAPGWQDVSLGRRLPAIKHIAHLVTLQMSSFDEERGIVLSG